MFDLGITEEEFAALSEEEQEEFLELKSSEWDDRCREDLSCFRADIHDDDYKPGWWQTKVSEDLMWFWNEFKTHRRPILVIEAPPQHGKSTMCGDFVAWGTGKDPDLKFIYASKSERLGIRANLTLQRLMETDRYNKLFPEARIGTENVVTIAGRAQRNKEFIEYVNRKGSFRNVTVEGQVNGEGMHIGIVDDPIKDRAQANSKHQRDKIWDWFTDVFFARMDEMGGLIFIMTRWNLDDPVGRIKEQAANAGLNLKVVSYPAIAIEDEEFRKAGEALFPEHKSLSFLKERQAMLKASSWSSLYQQNPTPAGGELFKEDWIGYASVGETEYEYRFIIADTALTPEEKSDYSCFMCFGKHGNNLDLLDVSRGQWAYPDLKKEAKKFEEKHRTMVGITGQLRHFKIEPKVSGISLQQDLENELITPVMKVNIPTSSQGQKAKVDRAEDVVGYIANGRFRVVSSPWVDDFFEEFTGFPSFPNDDQVDPVVYAFLDVFGSASLIPENVPKMIMSWGMQSSSNGKTSSVDWDGFE